MVDQRARRGDIEQHWRRPGDPCPAHRSDRAAVPPAPVALGARPHGGVQGHASYLLALPGRRRSCRHPTGRIRDSRCIRRGNPAPPGSSRVRRSSPGLSGPPSCCSSSTWRLLLALPNVGTAMTDPNLIPDVLTADLGLRLRQAVLRRRTGLGAQHGYRHAGHDRADDLRHGAQRASSRASKFLTRLSAAAPTSRSAPSWSSAILSLLPLIFIKRIRGPHRRDHGADHHSLHPGPRLAAGPPAAGLAARPVTVPTCAGGACRSRWWRLIWTAVILWDAAWPRAATNPSLGPMPVIEYLAIGVIVVGVVWWFASLRGKATEASDPAEPELSNK